MIRRSAIAFTGLCLLAGSDWMLDELLPTALPGTLGLLVNSAVLALLLFVWSRCVFPTASLAIFGYAALIFALPVAFVSLAGGRLSSTTIVLVYTLIPPATVFFAAQSSEQDLLRGLGPALAGMAGAALILPFSLPSSLKGEFWLGAMVLSAMAAGWAGLRLHPLLAKTSVVSGAMLAAVGVALAAIPLYALERPSVLLLTWPQVLLSESVRLGVQAATLLLSFRILRDLNPVASSTRFFLIPLVTIAEGYFLLHPTAAWTLPAGALLLAGGSARLLRGESSP